MSQCTLDGADLPPRFQTAHSPEDNFRILKTTPRNTKLLVGSESTDSELSMNVFEGVLMNTEGPAIYKTHNRVTTPDVTVGHNISIGR